MLGEPVFEFILALFRASVRSAGGRGRLAADRVEGLDVIDVLLDVELKIGGECREDAAASRTSDERHGGLRDEG